MLWLFIVAIVWYALASGAAFLVFAFDKLRAKQAQYTPASRVPEKTLLTLSLIGGFPGAMLAMHLIRHKTRKPVFAIVNTAASVVHAMLWLAAGALWLTLR